MRSPPWRWINQNSNLAISLGNLGLLYYYRHDYEHGYYYQSIALDIEQEVYGKNHPDVANSYYFISMSLIALNRHSEAVIYLKHIKNIYMNVYHNHHPYIDIVDLLLIEARNPPEDEEED